MNSNENHKNKITALLIALSFMTFISAENLIVDQSSMNQYEKDDYIYFDAFDFHGDYQGNNTNEEGPYADPIDRIYLPETFPILDNQFTIEAWVYSEKLANNVLQHRIIIGDNLSNPAHNDINRPPTITFHQDHQIRYGFGTGSDGFRQVVNDVRVDDEWLHVAFTFDGTTCKLFVNGELADSTDEAAGLIPNQVPISIIGSNFVGKMDEVRIWNTPREQEEIQSTMNSELNGDEEGLIAYFPMNVNEYWELEDYSENQNHATIDNVEILQEYYSNECAYPDGSNQCPFPTIRSALDVVESGDNIIIREGRYSEVLFKETLNFSYETEGPKITIEGDGGNVILDGTIPLNANWENSGGTYIAEVDMNDISKRAGIKVEDIYGLWIDDRYMIPAMPINFKNPTDPTTGTQNNPEPGTVWSLHLTAPYEYNNMVQDEYTVGDLDNLDGLEEWSFDKDNSRLHLIPGNNIPDSTNVRVRIRTNILSFEYSDNFEFKNIDFFAGAFIFHKSSFITLEDMSFSHSWESGLRHYELGGAWLWRGNYFHGGTDNTVRNCIFQYINDARPLWMTGSLNSLVENALFRYNDWFKNTTWTPSTTDNLRGDNFYTGTVGPNTWRYITSDHNNTGGITPGLQSLVEYARVENQYIDIDGSGINRATGNAVASTTRYSWLLNTNRNGMRFDGGCAGIDGVVHHVVSAGNKRGFRLKGDWHQSYHLTAYDNFTSDISMPPNKYCMDASSPDDYSGYENNQGSEENGAGNFNSQIHNCIVEGSLGCTSPDCGNPSITYTPEGSDNVDENIANLVSPEFLLNESGIWYGRMLNINHTTPFAYPQLELQMPWTENRIRSEESLVSQFGENPFENAIQDYDFRPKKGSILIDGGVVVPGINDGQNQGVDLNHAPLYVGQNRAYIGEAPDIGAYEYGDLVYWIPGFRYSYPSVPIPSDGAVNVPIEYGLAFNYPWKGTTATVSINGPGVNRIETLNYPENVVFETFLPGKTYNWSVDGESWSFTTSNKIYPLNDRSIDTTMIDMLNPYQTKKLQVSNNELAFLRFDIPSSIDNNDRIYLNLVPESVADTNNGIILYKYDYQDWSEKLNENNLGVIDHNFLTPLDTLFNIVGGIPVSIDITNIIHLHDTITADENNYDKEENIILSRNKEKVVTHLSKNKEKVIVNNHERSAEFTFAVGVLNSTDIISFHSKEKLITDGEYIQPEEGESHLGEDGGGSGFAPQSNVWPSITFELNNPSDNCSLFFGDLNQDEQIDVSDIILLIDCIMNASCNENENGCISDINNDENWNVVDVMALLIIVFDYDYDTIARQNLADEVKIELLNEKIMIKANGIFNGIQLLTKNNYSIINQEIPNGWELFHGEQGLMILNLTNESNINEMVINYEGDIEIVEHMAVNLYGNIIPSNIVGIPSQFSLNQNFPNPFNPTTTISFSIPSYEFVSIKVYDLNGRLVTILLEDHLNPGRHNITWNGKEYSSGQYFVKMKSKNYSKTQIMSLVK